MFSATFPKTMEAFARKSLYNPIEVTVGVRSIVCKDIIQNEVILDDEDQKYLQLLELLGISISTTRLNSYVTNLILVVNYDCPNHYEDYVHRSGRMGRTGNMGYADTFITPTQER
ncbi:unnamed protein product [Rotaria sp. Silwood2]|nr:unnamed protein product [Rotaria sp. Silwood2]